MLQTTEIAGQTTDRAAPRDNGVPDRESWRRQITPFTRPDARRSLGQIASCLPPYLAVWGIAIAVKPGPLPAVGLGLVATVFLMRMYALFHDLTHKSLFGSRRANTLWGYLLGFLLFTPYRWWQHQHNLHHAHAGDLSERGPGEIYTMTLAEYEAATPARRLYYRIYRNPVLLLLVGPSLVFLFDRRFPQKGMSRRVLLSVVLTNLALVAWAVVLASLVGWQTFLLLQGTTLVAGGAVGAWLLFVQHQYEDAYFRSPEEWSFELAALQGSSFLQLPRPLGWALGSINYHHVHHLSSRVPNYRLRDAHEGMPVFERAPVVTIRSGFAAMRLKLWDEERGALVPFPRGSRAAGEARAGA
ncbi:MAG: fatty acid desaturase [Actinobacteria bacterium]|nr:fatty acid desaturase [Actinomycetota bacterium]